MGCGFSPCTDSLPRPEPGLCWGQTDFNPREAYLWERMLAASGSGQQASQCTSHLSPMSSALSHFPNIHMCPHSCWSNTMILWDKRTETLIPAGQVACPSPQANHRYWGTKARSLHSSIQGQARFGSDSGLLTTPLLSQHLLPNITSHH